MRMVELNAPLASQVLSASSSLLIFYGKIATSADSFMAVTDVDTITNPLLLKGRIAFLGREVRSHFFLLKLE